MPAFGRLVRDMAVSTCVKAILRPAGGLGVDPARSGSFVSLVASDAVLCLRRVLDAVALAVVPPFLPRCPRRPCPAAAGVLLNQRAEADVGLMLLDVIAAVDSLVLIDLGRQLDLARHVAVVAVRAWIGTGCTPNG